MLKKAIRRAFVAAAIEEVSFRLGHPSLVPEVEHPYSMVRAIAECYSGRCRTEHGELHGEKALMYHRARRADVEQLLRAKGAADLNPATLGPLESLVKDLLPKMGSTEPDETEEERRARLRAELLAYDQWLQEQEKDE